VQSLRIKALTVLYMFGNPAELTLYSNSKNNLHEIGCFVIALSAAGGISIDSDRLELFREGLREYRLGGGTFQP
jgi:hypothetical protein